MHTLLATREGIFQASELPYSLTRPMHTEHPNLEFMVDILSRIIIMSWLDQKVVLISEYTHFSMHIRITLSSVIRGDMSL